MTPIPDIAAIAEHTYYYPWRSIFKNILNTRGLLMEKGISDIPTRIGIIGSGHISQGLILLLKKFPDLVITRVLSRTDFRTRNEFPGRQLLTNSVEDLIENADIIIECSGDAVYATDIIDRVMQARLPVITMDSEFQITTGSYFSRKGYLTEAEGDQPGCLAAMKGEAEQMGFRPLVYGNVKGYLNTNPTPADMAYWSQKNNIRLDKTIAFTDGTKVQIEAAFVANGLGADILGPGLTGMKTDDIYASSFNLAAKAKSLGSPISDYVLSSGSTGQVFITGEHDEGLHEALRYYKLGDGPFYTIIRNYHSGFFEIVKTIRRVLRGEGVLMNNGEFPDISVAAITKHRIRKGENIVSGIGSYDTRGIAIRIKENPDHVPIGLLKDAVVTRTLDPGQQISFDDIELPQTLALEIWQKSITKQ